MARSGTAKPFYNVTVRLSEDEFRFLEELKINKSQLFHDTIANIMESFKLFKEARGYPSSLLSKYKPMERRRGVKGLPLDLWINPPEDLLDDIFGDDEQEKDKYRHGKFKKDIEGIPYHG